MDRLRRLLAAHRDLKKKIHNFRIPLSRRGRIVMGCVYFTSPIIGGYFLMEWVKAKSEEKWRPVLEQMQAEKLERAPMRPRAPVDSE